MTLSRKSSRIYLDTYDIDGLINVLEREIGEAKSGEERLYLLGAWEAITLLRDNEHLDSQVDFMLLLHEHMRILFKGVD